MEKRISDVIKELIYNVDNIKNINVWVDTCIILEIINT